MHIKMETLFCVGTLDYKTFKGSYGIHVVRMDGEKGSLTHVSERNDGYNPSQFVKEYSPKSLRNREGFWYNRRKPPREAPSWKSTPKTPAAKQWLLT